MRSEKQQWIEIILVVLTGFLKYILMDWLEMRAFYIAGICIFWSVYVFHRYSKDHSILKHWGFRSENFLRSFFMLLPVILLGIFGSVLYGVLKGNLTLNWHVLPVLVLYPVWGVIQQFMMVDLIADNLLNLKTLTLKKYQSLLITALIFSLVHQPDILLMGITFLMETVFLMVFNRYRNLWALGLAHGWIATFILFYALERDLWIELFAWF